MIFLILATDIQTSVYYNILAIHSTFKRSISELHPRVDRHRELTAAHSTSKSHPNYNYRSVSRSLNSQRMKAKQRFVFGLCKSNSTVQLITQSIDK
jgi:hypothetical protein